MTREIKSFYDLGRLSGLEDGRASGLEEGEKRFRNMLKKCIVLRFPQASQTMVDKILSISDSDVLESIFNVACTADSLDSFQRDVRRTVSIN